MDNTDNLIYKLLYAKTDNLIVQLARYTVVGGMAFAVDYGLLNLLHYGLGMHYILAATVGFIAGLIVNYLISVKWVFGKSEIKNKNLEFLAFAAIGAVGLVLTNAIMYALTDWIGVPPYLSKLAAVVLVYLWNFLARRFLIFNAKPGEEGDSDMKKA